MWFCRFLGLEMYYICIHLLYLYFYYFYLQRKLSVSIFTKKKLIFYMNLEHMSFILLPRAKIGVVENSTGIVKHHNLRRNPQRWCVERTRLRGLRLSYADVVCASFLHGKALCLHLIRKKMIYC